MSSEVITAPFRHLVERFGQDPEVRFVAISGAEARRITNRAIAAVRDAGAEVRVRFVELAVYDVAVSDVIEIARSAVGDLREDLRDRLSMHVGWSLSDDLVEQFDAAAADQLAVVEAVLRPENLARLATDAERPPMAFTNSTVVLGSVSGTGVAIGAGASATVTGLTPEMIAAIRVTLSEVRGHIVRADISDLERAGLVAAVDQALAAVDEPGTAFETIRRWLRPIIPRLEAVGLGVLSSELSKILGP